MGFSGGFPSGSDSKESACNAGDAGLIPGSGRSLGEGNSNPLQYCCLETSVDKGAWWAAVYQGVRWGAIFFWTGPPPQLLASEIE